MCEGSWTAGQKIIFKQDEMIEFYKYLYAGAPPPVPPTNITSRYIPEME